MDTKWKNIIHEINNPKIRRTMPLILFFSIAIFIFSFSSIIKFSLSSDYLKEKSIFESRTFHYSIENIEHLIYELAAHKGEDYITSGENLDPDAIEALSKEIAINYINNSGYWVDEYDNRVYSDYTGDVETGIIYVNAGHLGTVSVMVGDYNFNHIAAEALNEAWIGGENSVNDVPNTSYPEYLNETNIYSLFDFYNAFTEEAEAVFIRSNMDNYNYLTLILNNIEGLVYRIESENHLISGNTAYSTDDFEKLPFYYIADQTSVTINGENIHSMYHYNMPSFNSDTLSEYYHMPLDSDTSIMFGIEEDTFIEITNNWRLFKALAFVFFTLTYASAAAALLSFAYLVLFAGKPAIAGAINANGPRPGNLEIKKSLIYSDISLGILPFIFLFSLILIAEILGQRRYYWHYFHPINVNNYLSYAYFIGGILISLLAAFAITYLLLSLISDYKNKRLLTHSLLYQMYRAFNAFLIYISNRIPVGYRIVSARRIIKVKEGIKRIQAGSYAEPIQINGQGHMAQIAQGINQISVGLNVAVEKRIKSERMKTELISNVSHDIRTPLTSIVTYVDLLKKEGNTPEENAKYLEVLESKTARLKILIDDLFEASKVSSGNIATKMAPTDLANVIEQAMGELEDRISASDLIFKFGLPSEKIYAMTDGKLLWRVINNLFSNIFKYSMPGSRVYIDLFCENDKAFITFKNMSAYELNISSEELMERFTRGDKSRNSEGSGLGLNIANSLISLMGGKFDISLDGDLFKVTIAFNKI